jgi:hypothetical protein
MVGLVTRLLVAQRTAAVLKAAGAPESATIEANSKWYYFGALGPAIGDFVPFEPSTVSGVPSRTSYYSVWKEALRIAVGDTTTGIPGIVPVLCTLTQFIDEVSAHVARHNFGAMKNMRDSGKLEVVKQASKDLGAILTTFSDQKKLTEIGKLMANNSRPGILNGLRKVPPSQWTGREWLHWKRPGTFATTLRQHAATTGDQRFTAYALGWSVSYATLVCGSGFMDSLVGAGYRNWWWRSRFVGNFVDTWTWGFYGANASMSTSDEPTPPYEQWPGVCNAGLMELMDLTPGLDAETMARRVVAEEMLQHVLPHDFVQFWLDAWTAAYNPKDAPLFTADRLQVAYLMLWITLWFQTSGDVIGCNTAPDPTPPDACGDHPTPRDWTDPTQTNPATGKPFAAPTPNAKHDPSIAEIVSGVILVIAGIASFFLGGAAVGVPAVAGGIGLIIDGEKTLNWDELECDMYWLRVYLYNGLDALHKLTVFSGIQHPYPRDLAQADPMIVQFNGGPPLSYVTAASVCKSRALESMHLPWDGVLSTWTSYPSNGFEVPSGGVWNLSGLWPSAIVEDAGINPATEDLTRSPAQWPGGVRGSFGPAVAASVRLIRSSVALPDWNLDGDLGRGWLTWELSGLYDINSPVPVVPES